MGNTPGNNPGNKRGDEWVIKDNLFHRRVSDVRNQVTWDFEKTEKAMDLLHTGTKIGGYHEQELKPLTEEEIEALAFFDAQTPCLKFQYMLRMLRRELKRGKRFNRPIAVLVVAIDGLSNIERQYGPSAADAMLAHVGERLNSVTRSDIDLAGRYVNERFLIILPETPGKGANIAAERLRKDVETSVLQWQWHKLQVTVSIGIAHRPGHSGEAEELIVQADMACESVERTGGNNIAIAQMTEFVGAE
ncbi:MAG: GGDEF domain-containing protein [Candidatus Melainabacteria bacterium]|jgi:diguanylate cyclase (GGDEF)-like protein|nr:GGDEF domain-containing protein [Candidatus Melainabacteria bacterium]